MLSKTDLASILDTRNRSQSGKVPPINPLRSHPDANVMISNAFISLASSDSASHFITSDLSNLYASLGFRIQHPTNEGPELWGEPPGAPELPRANLAVHAHEVAVVERQVAGGEREEHDAARPGVRLAWVVALLEEDLRSDVGGGPTGGGREAVGTELAVGEGAEAEVGELEVAALVQEQVLRLDVPVEHAARVRVHQRGDELPEEPARGGLVGPAPLLERGLDAAAAREVQHEVDGGAGGQDVQQAHDVRVALDAAERRELPLHGPARSRGVLGRARVVRLPDGLHGDAHAGADVARAVDLGGRATAKDAAELVPALEDLCLSDASAAGESCGGISGRRGGGGACTCAELVGCCAASSWKNLHLPSKDREEMHVMSRLGNLRTVEAKSTSTCHCKMEQGHMYRLSCRRWQVRGSFGVGQGRQGSRSLSQDPNLGV
ncbi:LOW QUALITY PROTEIN: hypothetical protein U9M48_043449 [Paspalum notatum var. saurae]|uniref:Uncharacterized protein n=1 Tax=Paspalum notatum var. saurae TaxID=547442 RepID=A0AAQ3UT60_PASNO